VDCKTIAPVKCDAAVVPFDPRIHPVNVFVEIPEYTIDSLSITIVPDEVNPDTLLSVIEDVELLIAPFKVLDAAPVTIPPHVPAPQPTAIVYVSEPEVI
jgi:hypothetical protein